MLGRPIVVRSVSVLAPGASGIAARLMLVEEAASRFDKTTFQNPDRERIIAKDELADLLELDRQMEEWINEEHLRK